MGLGSRRSFRPTGSRCSTKGNDTGMSYLEMIDAPLPNMSKGIISFWFRDPTAQADPPPVQDWTIPVPPNTLDPDSLDPEIKASLTRASKTFYNPYGLPIPGFGNFLLYPAPCTMPY